MGDEAGNLNAKTFPCFYGLAHPWLCDVMGHLTTRNYMAMFDDSSYRFAHLVFDFDISDKKWAGRGWADVKHTINYLREVPVGAPIAISGRLLKIGEKSFTALYEMRAGNAEEPAATLESVGVFFDLEARRAIPITPEMRAHAEALLS